MRSEFIFLSLLFCSKESFDGTRIKSSGAMLLRLYTPFVLSFAVFVETQPEMNLHHSSQLQKASTNRQSGLTASYSLSFLKKPHKGTKNVQEEK
jgi:hypothetical protein